MVKKNIKKRKFCKPYVFYGILIFLGVVLILFFVYGVTSSRSKISGRVVLGDYIDEASCISEGHVWENLTEQNCTKIITCVNETIDDCECLEYEDINGTQGDCINWSSCVNEVCDEEENCTEIIIGGECTGDINDEEDYNLEEDVQDENITEEIIEEFTNFLTDEERKILTEEFGDIVVKITKAELVEGGMEITFKLRDYFMIRFYDAELSEKNLEFQMESERIKWLKDIANTLSQKENDFEELEEFLGDYVI